MNPDGSWGQCVHPVDPCNTVPRHGFPWFVRNEPGKAGMFSVELYGRVRHACHVEGLSQREAARRFGIHRNTVRKMLCFAVPPGYRRRKPPLRPKLEPFTALIDAILAADRMHQARTTV